MKQKDFSMEELQIIEFVLEITKESDSTDIVCKRDDFRFLSKDKGSYTINDIEKVFGSYSIMKNIAISYLDKDTDDEHKTKYNLLKSKLSKNVINRENKELLEFNGRSEDVLKAIVKDGLKIDIKKFKKDPIKSKSKAESILVLSDWHYGEKVEPSSMNNLNEYDDKIARERIKKVFNDYDNYIKTNGIKVSHIISLGDMISGSIHDELAQTNCKYDTESTHEVATILTEYLVNLSQIQDKVYFKCYVGNHSRLTKERTFKTKVKQSLEYLMGMIIKNAITALQKKGICKNVIVDVPESFFTIENINGMNILFMHGDVSIGGIKGVRVMKNLTTMANELKSFDKDFDMCVIGHFHNFSIQSMNKRKIVCNGSLIGVNEYASGLGIMSNEISQTILKIEYKRVSEFKELSV